MDDKKNYEDGENKKVLRFEGRDLECCGDEMGEILCINAWRTGIGSTFLTLICK